MRTFKCWLRHSAYPFPPALLYMVPSAGAALLDSGWCGWNEMGPCRAVTEAIIDLNSTAECTMISIILPSSTTIHHSWCKRQATPGINFWGFTKRSSLDLAGHADSATHSTRCCKASLALTFPGWWPSHLFWGSTWTIIEENPEFNKQWYISWGLVDSLLASWVLYAKYR